MTREQYRNTYGVEPVKTGASTIDISPAPRRMTWDEYETEFGIEKDKSIFTPAKEAISGLKTFYGGGEQGIARKLLQDIKSGAEDIQKGNVIKGVLKSGARTAGDIAGAVFAPIGAVIEATGIGKLTDYLGGKLAETSLIESVTDMPTVQKFAITHPNAEEDFGRAMNLLLGKLEKGKVEPKTALPRTVEQFKTVVETVKSKAPIIGTERAVNNVAQEIKNIENNYVSTRKAELYEKDAGFESRKRIAQTDALVGAVDSEGVIRTRQPGGAVEKYRKATIDGSENIVRTSLKNEGKKVNIGQVAKELTRNVYESGLEGADLIRAVRGLKNELNGLKLRADEFGNIDLYKIHDAKISTTQNINYKTDSTPTIKFRKAKARAYKQVVEDVSEVSVDVGGKKFGIPEINKELGKYYSDIERLESLDGKRVKGGKLGKYIAQVSGNIVGATAGGAIGGLTGSAIGTIIGGEAAGFLKGKAMSRTFGEAKGKNVPPNPILERAKIQATQMGQNLKVADIKVSVPKDVVKTKDMYKLERDIEKNVEQQKVAIKKGDFTLVATLKEIYQVLVQKLKDLIQRYKETPNKQGGFVRIGKDYSNNLGSRNKQYKNTPMASKNPIESSISKTPVEVKTSFQGFSDITTKFLEYAKGKQFLSRQEILDFARRPELKRGEADLLNKLAPTENKVNAQDFADSIRRDLLELKPVKVKEPQYQMTTIHAQQGGIKNRGNNYEEVVFESPITTNGSSHYPNSKNYFAHARGDEVVEGGKKIWREQEIQSDLLQKDNLARQVKPTETRYASTFGGGVDEIKVGPNELKYNQEFNESLKKLDPFTNDRFGERIMRERIKEKAIKGYSKYRLPTGETIGKIEGFENDVWHLPYEGSRGIIDRKARIEDLKIGNNLRNTNGQDWIITDILGDGRFKAVQKETIDGLEDQLSKFGSSPDDAIEALRNGNKEAKEIMESAYGAETFDLTGKSNPQYKRYENWGKFLKNKFGGKQVTDPQGNTWYEIDLKPEYKKMPIEAFALLGAVGLGASTDR